MSCKQQDLYFRSIQAQSPVMNSAAPLETGATSVPLDDNSTNMQESDMQHDKPMLTFLNDERPDFLGAVVCFQDGTCWRLTNVLSNLAHQQADPPFEARQVSESVCIRDPEEQYTNVGLAVVKVKYQ